MQFESINLVVLAVIKLYFFRGNGRPESAGAAGYGGGGRRHFSGQCTKLIRLSQRGSCRALGLPTFGYALLIGRLAGAAQRVFTRRCLLVGVFAVAWIAALALLAAWVGKALLPVWFYLTGFVTYGQHTHAKASWHDDRAHLPAL